MNKFLPLLLCPLLSIFIVAHAPKTRTAVPNMKKAHHEQSGQEADAKTLLNDTNTGEKVPSEGDDSTEPASSDDGEDVNDDGGSDAQGDEDAGDNHAGDEDGGDGTGGDLVE